MNNENDRSGARLQLVASCGTDRDMRPKVANVHLKAVRSPATTAIALPSGTYDIRFTFARRSGAAKNAVQPDRAHQRRPNVRHQEGIVMKAFEQLVGRIGRFAVGFGCGLALVCASVIVTTDLGDGPKVVRPADIVHLDPVVVTISADRYAELQAQMHGVPVLVRTPGPGIEQG